MVVVVVVDVVVIRARASSDGSCTGVRKTMTQTTATRQPPRSPSSLRLCSSAPSRADRKKPLSKKKRTMLTELFTLTSVPKRGPAPTTRSNAAQLGRAAPGGARVRSASMVPLQSGSGQPEPRGKPVRSRHGPATVTEAPPGSRTARRPRESDTCCRGGADAFRGESALRPDVAGRRLGSTSAWSGRGVANLLSTILRVVTIG